MVSWLWNEKPCNNTKSGCLQLCKNKLSFQFKSFPLMFSGHLLLALKCLSTFCTILLRMICFAGVYILYFLFVSYTNIFTSRCLVVDLPLFIMCITQRAL